MGLLGYPMKSGENIMALPPIMSNSPIARFFTGSNPAQRPNEDKADQPRANAPRDTVSISDAAIAKLTEAQARETSENVRDTLAQNPGTSLTDDPDSLA
jgi:hypothetical protein